MILLPPKDLSLSRPPTISYYLLPSVTPGQELGDPDEDVDSVHVDAYAGIDRVEGRCSVANRMPLCLVDNLLSIIQQESSKQNKSPVHCHAVHASPQGSGGGQEGTANAGTEDKAKPHSERATHVEELVTWGTDSHSGQAPHHTGGVPGSPG